MREKGGIKRLFFMERLREIERSRIFLIILRNEIFEKIVLVYCVVLVSGIMYSKFNGKVVIYCIILGLNGVGGLFKVFFNNFFRNMRKDYFFVYKIVNICFFI